ncbi:carboxypeptidase-like regulatory domain-containing protein [Streptomyces xylophagus]|uniref:carboxypeptidase-like regulatory domain-containing protein n=1 Tax=Streptomyces xylophagus TaxID=285514 RepID=UPI0005B92FA8|nr:carboxypeptidase-like regulatory domain-containing protein [Streptomyces xylophagus]
MKARGFVLHQDTGRPVSGVNVVARARVNGTENSLGLLTTDEAGYVSFDLPGVVDGTVSLEIVGEPDSAATVAGAEQASDGRQRASVTSADSAVVLRVDPTRLGRGATPARPAIQAPDTRDWELSPASFVTPRTLALGEGDCATPVRSALPVQQIRFVQIVRRPTPPARSPVGPRPAPRDLGAAEPAGAPGRAEVSNPLLDPISPASDVVLGILPCDILEYEQTWQDVGESLGTLLYSLPLAPCESVRIAVIEAERSDEAARSDAIDAREDLTHLLFRDRNITETVKGALRESQGGSSFMAGQGAAYSGSWENVGTFGVTHAIGYASSQSWGRRKVEAASAQDLHDATVQNTGYVRSLNSTVIVHGSQAERHQLETRTITNHNHCHALTVQYYEVLRRLSLRTRLVGSRPGVLIPYRGLHFTSPYPTISQRNVLDTPAGHLEDFVVDPQRDDLHLVNRLRPMLQDSLLEPRLRPNFDAVRRLLFYAQGIPAPPAAAPATSDFLIERVDATVLRGRWGTDSDVVRLTLNGGGILFKEAGRLTRKVTLKDPGFWGDHEEYEDSPEELGPFKLQLASPVLRSAIKECAIDFDPGSGGSDFSLRGLKVLARGYGGEEEVIVDETSGRNFDGAGVEPFSVLAPKPPAAAPSDGQATAAEQAAQAAARRAQDVGLAWELITHLHDHRDTYGPRLVAMKEPMWFAEALDQAMGRGTARDSIDSVPVAISGHHLVFSYYGEDASSRPLPPDAEQPAATIVSLPTRGVLAEAQLGSCNACEKRDVTRFWKWEESPCEQPPEISGITPGFRGQPTQVPQGQLPNAVVQITQPPAAPDPVGLAAAMSLLGKGDAFRDMSGLPELQQLLSGLASGAVDLVKAKDLAAKVQSKTAASAAAGGGGAAASKRSPAEAYDGLQVAREVAAQAESLGWSPQTTESVTSGIVDGSARTPGIVSASVREPPPPPHHRVAQEVMKMLADPVIRKAYEGFSDFDEDPKLTLFRQNWWFTTNPKLTGVVSRPAPFGSWQEWDTDRDGWNWRHRTVVLSLAGFSFEEKYGRDATTWKRLVEAHARWPAELLAVTGQAPQRGGGQEAATCMPVTGDALYRAGIQLAMPNGKYPPAINAFEGSTKGPFFQLSASLVEPGDLIAWDMGGGHIEIVTSVDKDSGSLCSLGGGRGREDPHRWDVKCGSSDRDTTWAWGRHFARIRPDWNPRVYEA